MKYIYTLLLLFFASSCVDDLNQSNPNKIEKDRFYEDIDDVNASLNSVYSVLRASNTLGVTEEPLRSDIAITGNRRGVTSSNYLYNQNFDFTTAQINSRWAYLYRGIFYSNQVLEAADRIEKQEGEEGLGETDAAEMKLIRAQAHFFRGLFHYWASYLYNNGEIIIRTSVPQDPEDYPAKRSPKAKVLEFCIQEFLTAYKDLPEKWSSKELGRVTSGAVAAYLGQLYLYEANYEEAKKWFKVVMDHPDKPTEEPYYKEGAEPYNYELTLNLDDNFYDVHEFNSESIFEVNYSTEFYPEEGGNSDTGLANSFSKAIAPNGQGSSIGGNSAVLPPFWLMDSLRNEKMDFNDTRNFISYDDPDLGEYLNLPYILDATGKKIVSVTKHKRKIPLRAVQTVAFVDDDCESLYYGYPPYYCENRVAGKSIISYNSDNYSYFKKFTNCKTLKKEDIVLSRSGINFRLMRLADVYLMYAECLIEGGINEAYVQEALDYINQIRQRSALVLRGHKSASTGIDASRYKYTGDGPTYDEQDYTAAQVMNALMWCERPLELCLEGFSMRSIDLNRWARRFNDNDFVYNRYRYINSFEYLSRTVNGVGQNYCFYEQYRNEPNESFLTDAEKSAGYKVPVTAAPNYTPHIYELLNSNDEVVAYIQFGNLTQFQLQKGGTNKPCMDNTREYIPGSGIFYIDHLVKRWNDATASQIEDRMQYVLNFTDLPLLSYKSTEEQFAIDAAAFGLKQGRKIQEGTYYVKNEKNGNIKIAAPVANATYRLPLLEVGEVPGTDAKSDFDNAVLNYTFEANFTYPIPQTEVQNNPMVNEINE